IYKYAQPGTRVYLNVENEDKKVRIIFRNVSEYPLNINGEELMERFVRGDKSRHKEGNGLGLSIAMSLAQLQGGSLKIITDGDLFKAVLEFPMQQG
ncbi:MAG: sensor histidine kinase, partial [Lachnospiraceae bacterium]|nr:sensor histidine kinase [Lachnospiraceae bacterium]